MTSERRSLALLRSANPVTVDLAAAGSPHARDLFEQIVAQPRDRRGSGGRRLGGLRLRSRLAFGGAGIAAAAVAVIVAVFSGSAATPAFAGWTARPTAAARQQITSVTRACHLTGPPDSNPRRALTAGPRCG